MLKAGNVCAVIFALIICIEWGALVGHFTGLKHPGFTADAVAPRSYYKVRSKQTYAPISSSQTPNYHRRVYNGHVTPIVVQTRRLYGIGKPHKTYDKPIQVRARKPRKIRTKVIRKKPRKIKVTYERSKVGKRRKYQTVKLQSVAGNPVVKPTEGRLRKVINRYRTPFPIGSSTSNHVINQNKQIPTKASIFTTRKLTPTPNRITTQPRSPIKPSHASSHRPTSNSQTAGPLIREVLTNDESVARYGIKAPPGFRVVTTRASGSFNGDYFKTSKSPTTRTQTITLPTGVVLTLGANHKPTKSSLLRIDTTSVNDAYNVLRGIGTGYRVKLTPTQALGKQNSATDVDFTATAKSTLPPVRNFIGTPEFNPDNVILNDDANRYGTGEQSGMRLLKQFMAELNELWHSPTESVAAEPPPPKSQPQPTVAEHFDMEEGDTPWYNGSNVCQRESLSLHGLSKTIRTRLNKVTICNEVWPNYICTERYSNTENGPRREVVYHCCEGFERKGGYGDCTKKITPRLLEEFGRNEGDNDVAGFGVLPGEENSEIITFFMPTDDVVNEYLLRVSLDDPNNVKNFLENHVVVGEHYESADIQNNDLIEAHSKNSIRVNFFEPGNIMTVNCIHVSQRDVQNGDTIVHVIDGIIDDVKDTIYEYIVRNEEMFTVLRKFIEDGGLEAILNDTDGQFTLFAPTDKAMLSDVIVSDAQACAHSFIKHHVVDDIVCLSSISEEANLTSSLGDRYTVARTSEDEIFVDDSRVVTRDIMTLNGVIHIIDSPLRSSQSWTLLDVISRNPNATTMLQLFEEGGMSEAIATSDNFTLLIPVNDAFNNTPMYYKNYISNPYSFRRMLLLHFIPSPVLQDNLKRQSSLSTLDPPNTLNVQTYYTKTRVKKIGRKTRRSREMFTAVQCAKVLKVESSQACNGNFIFINQVLLPPSGTILETLQFAPNGNFSILIRAIEIAGLKQLLEENSGVTMFAPTNRAFASLPRKFLRSIMRSGKMLRKIVLFHIINGHHCCDSLMQHAKSHQTLYGRPLTTCPKRNKLYIGRSKYRLRAQTNACDISSTNGLIHGVNQMLIPVNLKSRK